MRGEFRFSSVKIIKYKQLHKMGSHIVYSVHICLYDFSKTNK